MRGSQRNKTKGHSMGNSSFWFVLILSLAACNGENPPVSSGDEDAAGDSPIALVDSDGDGIDDLTEGNADPDEDGLGNDEDDDSDGDGISDGDEAGDADLNTPPRDSDGDGIPDYLDEDSDGDFISDAEEGINDIDGDSIPAYLDEDSDGDTLSDADEAGDVDLETPARDWDLDGTPDFLELDSDKDTISDHDEGLADVDLDDWPNYIDEDSDGDGLSDRLEAGDADLATLPVDSDEDGTPDFLDFDSDNDGISDEQEASLYFTNPRSGDSDEDGASDLVEIVAGTDPNAPGDNPEARGEFVFVVPHGGVTAPSQDSVSYASALTSADVYFLVDTTGSMEGEISNLQSSLTRPIIPGIQAVLDDVYFGVGAFDDYPDGTHGSTTAGDRAFYSVLPMTNDTLAVQNAVNSLSLHGGQDFPESQVPALHALATGCGDGTGAYAIPNDPLGACTDPSLIGYAHFRAGAIPIIVLITDAQFHNGPSGANAYAAIPGVTPPTFASTVDALNSINARVIGINSGDAATHLTAIASATGTVGPAGPIVQTIDGNGTGLDQQVIDAVETLAADLPMDVTAVAIDDPSDSVNAVSAFIDKIVANSDGGGECASGLSTIDTSGDSIADTFLDVIPGTVVCFDIIGKENTEIESNGEPQVFGATILIWADHVTVLEERNVYFIVPP